MTPTEIKRLFEIIRVLLTYGIDESLPKHALARIPRALRPCFFGCVTSTQISVLESVFALRCKLWDQFGSNLDR